MERISGRLSGIGGLKGHLQGTGQIQGRLSMLKEKEVPTFSGAYEYTPSESAQTIEIEGYKAIQNIVINPIPQNYGLVTWNGSTLTIS